MHYHITISSEELKAIRDALEIAVYQYEQDEKTSAGAPSVSQQFRRRRDVALLTLNRLPE